jgi:hypothetical protein
LEFVMAIRTCEDCGEQLEDTALNFPVYKKRVQKCIGCVVRLRRAAADAKREKRSRQMGRMEEAAVDTLLHASRKGGTNIPHSAELLEQLMVCFGGVNGFSQLLLKNYFDAPAGSAQRTKIMEMITKLVTVNADQGGSKKPLALWSEEELEGELDLRIRQAIGAPMLTLEVVSEAAAVDPGNV